MAVIALSKGKEWFVARWAFRRFLEDVSRARTKDPTLVQQLQQAIALDGLHFEFLTNEESENLLAAMQEVATAIVHCSESPSLKWKAGLDDSGRKMFREAVARLLTLMREQRGER